MSRRIARAAAVGNHRRGSRRPLEGDDLSVGAMRFGLYACPLCADYLEPGTEIVSDATTAGSCRDRSRLQYTLSMPWSISVCPLGLDTLLYMCMHEATLLLAA